MFSVHGAAVLLGFTPVPSFVCPRWKRTVPALTQKSKDLKPQTVSTLCYNNRHTCHFTFIQTHWMYTSEWSLNINCELQKILRCWCRFISGDKGTTLLGTLRLCMCGGQETGETSYLQLSFAVSLKLFFEKVLKKLLPTKTSMVGDFPTLWWCLLPLLKRFKIFFFQWSHIILSIYYVHYMIPDSTRNS